MPINRDICTDVAELGIDVKSFPLYEPVEQFSWSRTSSETQGQSFRGGRNGATKVFKNGRKNPWVPSLTGLFPNGFANTGSWLGRKNQNCIILPNQEPVFAKPFGNGPVRLGTQGFFRPFLKTFVAPFRPPPTDCPWVSEDGSRIANLSQNTSKFK